MSTIWTTPAGTTSRDTEVDPAILAAADDALAIADAWRAGELPLGEAISLVLAEPRAIGHAFRHRWEDSRRPALEALHAIEYAQREDEWGYRKVYTSFGWISSGTWDQVQRHMQSPDIDHLRYTRKAS